MAQDKNKPPYEIYNAYISRVQGTENEYYCHFDLNTPADNGLKSVKYQWYYTVGQADSTSIKKGSGDMQMIGPSGSIDWEAADTRVWTVSYTPPETAKKIRLKLTPVSKKKKGKNGKETETNVITTALKPAYVPGPGAGQKSTDWFTLYKKPKVKDVLKVTNVAVTVQSAGSRTLVATWNRDTTAKSTREGYTDKFLYNYVASYSYEWRYKIGTIFYTGTEGSVDVTDPRNCTYTPPENATEVVFRVKAIPKETQVVNGFTVAWFVQNKWYPENAKTKASEWCKFTMPVPVTTDLTITVEPGTVQIQRVTGSDRAVFAKWSEPTGYDKFTQYTDGYSYTWQYYAQSTWFPGSEGTINIGDPLVSEFGSNENATAVRFRVKPIPKTVTISGQEKPRYKTKYTGWQNFSYSSSTLKPETPSAPDFTADDKKPYMLTAKIDTYNKETKGVEFQFIMNNDPSTADIKSVNVVTARAQITIAASPGNTYKVRCRGVFYENDTITPLKGDWSEYSSDIVVAQNADDPDVPSVPTVSMNTTSGYKLEMSVTSYDEKTKAIQFYIVQDDIKFHKYISANLIYNRAGCTVDVPAGHKYKVRCRALAKEIEDENVKLDKNIVFEVSAWSEFSENVATKPSPVVYKTIKIKATTSTSVSISWGEVSTAESYTIEYTNDETYFDAAPDQVQSVTISSGTQALLIGLESGHRYYFRIKASNSNGDSEWSSIFNTVCGTVPNAPTVWSSSSTASVGETVLLYWTHNSEDASAETFAQLLLTINGTAQDPIPIPNESPSDTGRRYYSLDTSSYENGATIVWRVRTKGILDSYGPYSEARRVDIYSPPTLSLNVQYSNVLYWDGTDEQDPPPSTIVDWMDISDDRVNQLPIRIQLSAEPSSQTPISYSISIISGSTYEDIDYDGRTINVVAGQEIYNKYIASHSRNVNVIIGAGNINFQNGARYQIKAVVAMNSGLTAETSYSFDVSLDNVDFGLDAEISYDSDAAIAYIRPYSIDDYGEYSSGIVMSLYRREFDGSLTLLADGLNNEDSLTVTDPHPSLDYARYRVVGTSYQTGVTTYVDLSPYPTGETSIILQWDEEYTTFSNQDDDELLGSRWSGSMLRLPWNVDISDSNTIDVEMVQYIGRKYPVSYFGTQVGQTASWKTVIPAYDTETLYGLRRLAVYMGNVYVREPSGTGYWAQVKVQISKNHCDVTIPVTLDITRVEGGM